MGLPLFRAATEGMLQRERPVSARDIQSRKQRTGEVL
jgi:hypothetical protein